MTSRVEGVRTKEPSLPTLNFLLSPRGWILSAFLLYIFSYSVLKHADIIGAVLVYSFLAYIILISVTTAFLALRLRSGVSAAAFQPEPINGAMHEGGGAAPNEPALFALKLTEVYIPPGYYLEVQVQLEQGDLKLAKHIVSGRVEDGRVLSEIVHFPHRGYWRIAAIQFFLADRLNLTYFKWAQTEDPGIRDLVVSSQAAADINLPIVSSSARSGDDLPDVQERQGDPFDLKAYHPSDGMKKILWKIYAKSGELISRHPEASMTPEGQVVVFAVSPKNAEEVCSVSLAYLKKIEELNMQLRFACLGIGDSGIASDSRRAQKLLMETVWNSDLSKRTLLGDLQALLDDFGKAARGSRLDRLVIICSQSVLSTREGKAALVEAGDFLESQSIKPFFAVCLDADTACEVISLDYRPPLWERVFFSQTFVPAQYDIKLFHDFIGLCRNRGWDLAEQQVV